MSPFNPEESRFGEIVRDKRNEKGFTLRKFAQMADLSPSYISLMERGEQPPPGEEKIRQIALILDLNVDTLLAEAGKVSTELKDIIIQRPALVADFLRTVKGTSTEDLMRLNQGLKSQSLHPHKPQDPTP